MKKTSTKKPVQQKKHSQSIERNSQLVITVLGDCHTQNNQSLDPPHLSKTGGGFPNKLSFQAVNTSWICLPPGFLAPEPASPILVEAGIPSDTYTVRRSAGRELHYQVFCQAEEPACPKDVDDGDVIIIEN